MVYDTDSARTTRRRLATERDLVPQFGPGTPEARLSWFGAARWRHPTLRDAEEVSIVVAISHTVAGYLSAHSRDSINMFAAIVAHRLGLAIRDTDYMDQQRLAHVAAHHVMSLKIDSAAELAQIAATAAAPLQHYHTLLETDPWSGPRFTDAERDSFPSALGAWLTAARRLSPSRRSAALFVADEVLDESDRFGGWPSDDSTLLRPLNQLGAVFVPDPLGGGFQYDHTWLKEAARIAPASRGGQLAFLELMGMGFETNVTCSSLGLTAFRAVPARGPAYLRRYPPTPIAPMIHGLIAAAYGDIVTAAAGGSYLADEDSTERRRYSPEAAQARRHAIAEYVIALRTLRDPVARQAAWSEAWRLLAGIAPEGMQFECIYD